MDYTKKHRESTHSLLMEKWGYGKNKIEEGQELEEAGMQKSVKTFKDRLDKVDQPIKAIDDPIEVLQAIEVLLNKIEALNPDYVDGEKRKTFTELIKGFREDLKNVGKKDTPAVELDKDKVAEFAAMVRKA